MTTRFPYTAQLYTQNPESFADVYNGPMGAAYWDFLTRPEHVLLMEGATFLKQPAIAVLGPRLVQEFGPNLGAPAAGKTTDRIKQVLGHMVKDVLASLGYKIEQRNVPIDRFGTIFTTATRYTL